MIPVLISKAAQQHDLSGNLKWCRTKGDIRDGIVSEPIVSVLELIKTCF
ncbi:MAG: hypothetical protein WAM14_25335 [Candidatus Nitrosopolaris sp.]